MSTVKRIKKKVCCNCERAGEFIVDNKMYCDKCFLKRIKQGEMKNFEILDENPLPLNSVSEVFPRQKKTFSSFGKEEKGDENLLLAIVDKIEFLILTGKEIKSEFITGTLGEKFISHDIESGKLICSVSGTVRYFYTKGKYYQLPRKFLRVSTIFGDFHSSDY